MKKLERESLLTFGLGCTFFGGMECGGAVAAAVTMGWTPLGWIAGVAAVGSCGGLINSCWNSK